MCREHIEDFGISWALTLAVFNRTYLLLLYVELEILLFKETGVRENPCRFSNDVTRKRKRNCYILFCYS